MSKWWLRSIHVQEAEKTPPKLNENRLMPRHITAQFANLRSKENNLESGEAEEISYVQREEHQNNVLSMEIWQARKGWQDMFRILNEKNMEPRILYPARLSFRMDGETRSFQDWQKLKEYVTTMPALKEILREFYKSKKTPRVI